MGTARFRKNVLGVTEDAALREASVMLGSNADVFVCSDDMGSAERFFQCDFE